MHKFGALSRRDGGWFSCNDIRFYECTVLSLISKQLAIYSINEKLPGRKFVRLNENGNALADAIIFERDARIQANKASKQMNAEIERLTLRNFVAEGIL